VIQPVALAERIWAQVACLQRVAAAMDRRGPPPDESAVEWHRARDEVRMVLAQHEAFERGPAR
jgi:primosomal protein N''